MRSQHIMETTTLGTATRSVYAQPVRGMKESNSFDVYYPFTDSVSYNDPSEKTLGAGKAATGRTRVQRLSLSRLQYRHLPRRGVDYEIARTGAVSLMDIPSLLLPHATS